MPQCVSSPAPRLPPGAASQFPITAPTPAPSTTNPTASSNDSENLFFHWWPRKGTEEWVEYSFESPATVSNTQVYWFDDTGTGECHLPAAWRILYRDGQDWKPIDTTEPLGTEKDRFNEVKFQPVTTTGLRLEVTLQPGWSAGIQEWKVE
jgi:uncharacterized protein